jgi:hypothetical protein
MQLPWARIDAGVHDCWLRLSALHITLLPSFSHDGKEKNERVIVSLCNFRVDMMPSWDVFILDVALSSARREVLVIVHVLCSPKMTALSSHSLSLSRHSVSSNLRAIYKGATCAGHSPTLLALAWL